MKRYVRTVLCVLLVTFQMSVGAYSQEAEKVKAAQALRDNLAALEAAVKAKAAAAQGQRSGGGSRGVPVQPIIVNPRIDLGSAWWTNTELVTRLGLTDDQKAKIERSFENHRSNIISTTAQLEREEAQLARLLEADPIDRNSILSQTDRVIQARGEMERANAAMTLEMREHLTRAQWMQLQTRPVWLQRDQRFYFRGGRGGGAAEPAPAPGVRGRRGGAGQ